MLLLNLLLGLAWVFLTGNFDFPNFFFGFFVGFLILWLVSDELKGAKRYSERMILVPSFILYFVYKLSVANFKVAWEVLTPTHYMTPGIVAVPLDIKGEVGIALLANLITLTPGTLSVDVSENGEYLYVHSMHIKDPEQFRQEVKDEFESKLRAILE